MALLLEETPHYKIQSGASMLADIELLSLLISGNPEKANQKARVILNVAKLKDVSRLSVADLKTLGLSTREANRVVACFEIGRRRELSEVGSRLKINSSKEAYEVVGPLIRDLDVEEFWMVFLNTSNEVIGKKRISVGGLVGTVVDVRIVFKAAIENKARGIIVYHNHPSGSLEPSASDISTTQKIKKGGELLEITLLDHLIVSEQGYYSFADKGMI